jgi:hypothetical protein
VDWGCVWIGSEKGVVVGEGGVVKRECGVRSLEEGQFRGIVVRPRVRCVSCNWSKADCEMMEGGEEGGWKMMWSDRRVQDAEVFELRESCKWFEIAEMDSILVFGRFVWLQRVWVLWPSVADVDGDQFLEEGKRSERGIIDDAVLHFDMAKCCKGIVVVAEVSDTVEVLVLVVEAQVEDGDVGAVVGNSMDKVVWGIQHGHGRKLSWWLNVIPDWGGEEEGMGQGWEGCEETVQWGVDVGAEIVGEHMNA